MTAAELFAQPNVHCKDWLALDSNGSVTGPNAPNAVQYCAVGALQRVYDKFYEEPLNKCVEILISEGVQMQDTLIDPIWTTLAVWNNADERTQEDVRQLFEKAGV